MVLKGWMVKTGISLEEFAEKVGISVPYLCNIANGKALPRLDVFAKIAKLTKIDTDELLEDTLRLHALHGKAAG